MLRLKSLHGRKRTGEALLLLAERATRCASSSDLAEMVRETVQPLLPHSWLLGAVAHVELHRLEVVHVEVIDSRRADAQASELFVRSGVVDTLRNWLADERPDVRERAEFSGQPHCVTRDGDDSRRRTAVHGVPDATGRSCSLFIFGGVADRLQVEQVRTRLELIVPHLHRPLVACTRHAASRRVAPPNLTATERELLGWVAAGRTNVEIAALRGRSPATVRNQLTAAFKKLGVGNRAAATRAFDATEWDIRSIARSGLHGSNGGNESIGLDPTQG